MKHAPQTLLLASSSPWRLGLLREAGVVCEALAPGVDEALIQDEDPVALAISRAVAKAQAVAVLRPGAMVVGADQVAHMDGEVFGKPEDDVRWRLRLQSLRGRTHWLTTGVALVRRGEDPVDQRFSVTTGVRLRADLSDAELDAYIATGEARGCAGGYMVERVGAWLVESIDGDWLNVVGLPVLQLLGRLRALGWRLEPR